MTTKEKIDKIKEFLHKPENQLIPYDNENSSRTSFSLGTFFDIEVSQNPTEIDFSISIKVNNELEAISILKELSINKQLEEIQSSIKQIVKSYNLNPEEQFYLTIKGNKAENNS